MSSSIARPPSPVALAVDRWLTRLAHGSAYALLGLVGGVLALIIWQAGPALTKLGVGFLAGQAWEPTEEVFGILPEIYGTVVSSLLGVAVGSVLGVAVAIVLSQDFLPPRIEAIVQTTVDLLAAVPSVVYGLWGIVVVVPFVRPFCQWVHHYLGWIPLFSTPLHSVGLFPAALVLGIMIVPTIAALSREALAALDPRLREAAFGLGATRWEVIGHVLLPTAQRGIWGAIALGFGRALGETMALAMLIGSTHVISPSLFSPANTLATLLANKFPEAATPLDIGVLMYAALVLLGLTVAVQLLGTRFLPTKKGKP